MRKTKHPAQRRAVQQAAPSENKRCTVYLRTATLSRATACPVLAAQRDPCIAYIRDQPGWILAHERYDGGYGGSNTRWPELQLLLADVDRGHVDVVVVHRSDRLSRSLLERAALMERFENAGVGFVSVADGFSTLEPAGQRRLKLLAASAELERTWRPSQARVGVDKEIERYAKKLIKLYKSGGTPARRIRAHGANGVS
jgi:site-specific DNA recombinase